MNRGKKIRTELIKRIKWIKRRKKKEVMLLASAQTTIIVTTEKIKTVVGRNIIQAIIILKIIVIELMF